MFRRFVAIILIALAFTALAVYAWATMTATTVSIGSGAVAFVQKNDPPQIGYPLFVGGAPITLKLPVASTAGTCLIAVITYGSGASANQTYTLPAGWTKQAQAQITSVPNIADYEIWTYANNPGGIQTVQIAHVGSIPSAPSWLATISEWTNVASIGTLETSGMATASAGTSLTLTTTGSVVTAGDLVLVGWIQLHAFNSIAYTPPPGFTSLVSGGDNGAATDAAFQHMEVEYQIGPLTGAPLTPIVTSNRTTQYAAGAIIVLKAAPPILDQTAYLKYGSLSTKQNTADFTLTQGGYLLLEDGGRLQLEDGSGYLLLDTVVPSLGDPVTITNPTWSGRVVSTALAGLTDTITNYREIQVAATNNTVASVTTAPGNFSDVVTGGHLLLEDGSGALLLESGDYLLLEGTAFPYVELQVRSSQNQDGTLSTYGSLKTYETGFAAGQTVTITSTNLGLAAVSCTITNVTQTWLGAALTGQPTPAYLIEFGDAYQTLQTVAGGAITRTAGVATQQLGVVQPGGVLGYAQVTANQATLTTEVDLTGLTVTVTVGSGRRLRLSYSVTVSSSVANDAVAILAYDGAATVVQTTLLSGVGPIAFQNTMADSVILTPSTGVHTYKLTAKRNSGTGNISAPSPGTTTPAYILVEDIGT